MKVVLVAKLWSGKVEKRFRGANKQDDPESWEFKRVKDNLQHLWAKEEELMQILEEASYSVS